MAVDKKTVNKGEKKSGSFGAKVGNFFKKIGGFFKNVWAKFKAIQWTAPVKPVVAWSVIGGVLLVSVALMLIFWL